MYSLVWLLPSLIGSKGKEAFEGQVIFAASRCTYIFVGPLGAA